ncbi:MAG: potassium channel family protein [Thermodesulfobacteriota bacterium]
MAILIGTMGVALILIVLGDAFETIVLPRRVTRPMSLARLFYRYTWLSWSAAVRSIFSNKRQEGILSWYGPLSLLLLLILWATCLVIGFGLVHWASGSIIKAQYGGINFWTYLYLSGTTFFTLGIGDVLPATTFGRALIAFEAGMGFGFLALVIGYLPVLNQSFSRREVTISLLDERAGSPPTAGEMLLRHSHDRGMEDLRQIFHEWERWSAELLESHLSYPVLGYFRSQHDNQSWLGLSQRFSMQALS